MKYDTNRLYISIGIFSITISIAGYFIFETLTKFDGEPSTSPLIIIASLFLVGLALLMFAYLKGGQNIYVSSKFNTPIVSAKQSHQIDIIGDSLEKLISRISGIEKKLKNTLLETDNLTEKDREELLNIFKNQIGQNVTDDFLKAINIKYGESIAKETLMNELGKHCDRTESRLASEIESLTRRGNINLVIGVLTTLIAVGILASTVLSDNIPHESENIIAYFIPRFTLSIFIEVFSFFFLRLYSTSLNDIKYFQNELTNIESRFIALRQCYIFR